MHLFISEYLFWDHKSLNLRNWQIIKNGVLVLNSTTVHSDLRLFLRNFNFWSHSVGNWENWKNPVLISNWTEHKKFVYNNQQCFAFQIKMLTKKFCRVTLIPWNLVNLSHRYFSMVTSIRPPFAQIRIMILKNHQVYATVFELDFQIMILKYCTFLFMLLLYCLY